MYKEEANPRLMIDRCAHLQTEKCRQSLPGYPRIDLHDHATLEKFLEKEVCSDDVDRMSSKLWMMSMQSSMNISPLHRQRVKQRAIVITEDPKLHLVWFHDRIFIKPLPTYLLCRNFWAFWKEYFHSDDDLRELSGKRIRSAAFGYLRTWRFLIKHESDFRIAQESNLQLVPRDINWEGFCEIATILEQIADDDVSERYRYGEIRLTRLNFYAKIFLGKRAYQRMHAQYSEYFAQFYAPVLFILGLVSVLLNCMQLVMAVEQVNPHGWVTFWGLCRWFSIIGSVVLVLFILSLAALFTFKFLAEWKQALADRNERRRQGNGSCA